MKVERGKRGCRSIIWYAIVLPVIFGLLIGFVVVVAAFHLGQGIVAAQSLPGPLLTSGPVGPTRFVVLLLDGAEEEIVGVWQWWSDLPGNPGKAACILSPATRSAPSGRTVGEMIRLAMAAGDDSWVARNTQDFAGDCLPGHASAGDQVIFVSQQGLIELVDALGGIQLEKRELDGIQTWNYLVPSGASPADIQRRHQAVWSALKTAARGTQQRACDRIAQAEDLFRSVPNREDSCSQLETLLLQTPPYIATP
jgi:hypothetical protein